MAKRSLRGQVCGNSRVNAARFEEKMSVLADEYLRDEKAEEDDGESVRGGSARAHSYDSVRGYGRSTVLAQTCGCTNFGCTST